MIRVLAIISILTLTGCSGLAGSALKTAFGAVSGSGPSLDAQVGKTNSKTVGSSRIIEMPGPIARPDHVGRDFTQTSTQSADESKSRTESGDAITIETPAWIIIAFAVALFLDSPLRWPGQIVGIFRGRRDA